MPYTTSSARTYHVTAVRKPGLPVLYGHCRRASTPQSGRFAGAPAAFPPFPQASQPPERDLLDQVALALGEDQVGALARGEDVFVQIDEVNPRPDGNCGRGSLLICQLR